MVACTFSKVCYTRTGVNLCPESIHFRPVYYEQCNSSWNINFREITNYALRENGVDKGYSFKKNQRKGLSIKRIKRIQ